MSALRGQSYNSNAAQAISDSLAPVRGSARTWVERVRCFFAGEEAATAVEYAVMLALVLLAVIGSVFTLGNETNSRWVQMGTDMTNHGLGGS